MTPRIVPPEVRFWRYVTAGAEDECWLWRGYRNEAGYGRFSDSPTTQTGAHRFSYRMHFGPFDEALTIDHLCFTPSCVNPAHLEAVTLTENVRRAWARSRTPSGQRAKATHCKRGHEYAVVGQYARGRCRACHTASVRRTYARTRAVSIL